jgi:hypothetical protein
MHKRYQAQQAAMEQAQCRAVALGSAAKYGGEAGRNYRAHIRQLGRIIE